MIKSRKNNSYHKVLATQHRPITINVPTSITTAIKIIADNAMNNQFPQFLPKGVQRYTKKRTKNNTFLGLQLMLRIASIMKVHTQLSKIPHRVFKYPINQTVTQAHIVAQITGNSILLIIIYLLQIIYHIFKIISSKKSPLAEGDYLLWYNIIFPF